MTTRALTPSLTEETVIALSQAQGEPDWLRQRRVDAWRAFEAMALPNPAFEEEWRRTNLRDLDLDAILKAASRQLGHAKANPRLPRALAIMAGEAVLAQSDGAQVSANTQALPKGVLFTDLHTAAREHPDLVQAHLHTLVQPTEWKLQALQAALWQGGGFVYVPRGVDVTLPLRYASTQTGSLLASHLLVVAEANSSVTIVQDDLSADAAKQTLVSGAVEIVAAADARVSYVAQQRWGSGVYAFSTIRARLDRGARLSAALVSLGSHIAKTRLEVTLAGEGASTELIGLIYGDLDRHYHLTTLQDHVAPHTSSDLLFKAALTDNASEVWNGTVRIQKGASASEANQTSRNLLLSEHAKAAPIPVLEIEAYDVLRCSHGATAGPVDPEQRFYLESRGIAPADAERLLIEAFLQEVVDRLPAASVRDQLTKTLGTKISGR